ncbi:MAG TPA: hypothetical protein VNH11_30265 [Pirellulales bacterium]|nr:hypothetical protein [Pirellulales bacterium]
MLARFSAVRLSGEGLGGTCLDLSRDGNWGERNIVQWRLFDGMLLAEIARRPGWSRDSVERSVRRSIKTLKRWLPAAGK